MGNLSPVATVRIKSRRQRLVPESRSMPLIMAAREPGESLPVASLRRCVLAGFRLSVGAPLISRSHSIQPANVGGASFERAQANAKGAPALTRRRHQNRVETPHVALGLA